MEKNNNNTSKSNIRTSGNKLEITIIPFNYRKSPILSISFRSFDLELGKYKLKIESDGDNMPKLEFYSNFTDNTLVSKILIFILF